MNLNIKITQKGTGFKNDEELVNIDICNGNWKYWDNYFEGYGKESLTINTINKAHYIQLPVKDVYSFHDNELYEKTGEIQVKEVSVRTYPTLLEYLNCRIENVKEDYKKGTYKLLNYDEKGGRTFTATIFENNERIDDADTIKDITYNCKGLIEVQIKVVE